MAAVCYRSDTCNLCTLGGTTVSNKERTPCEFKFSSSSSVTLSLHKEARWKGSGEMDSESLTPRVDGCNKRGAVTRRDMRQRVLTSTQQRVWKRALHYTHWTLSS